MNEFISKLEATVVDDSILQRPETSPSEPSRLSESSDEIPSDENTERRLYRWSVAYFLFGFGCDKNAIITDEP